MHETPLTTKDRHHLMVERWKKVFQANESKKRAGVAILIVKDFRPTIIKRNKEVHYIPIKEKSTKRIL